ncbi:MAG: sigma-70 family RNA polymerase sigma factor [Planctomycetes bacterium]|nr:sigma-70 family RNA polymerase sigma factor [Planctomycetota bacterium]
MLDEHSNSIELVRRAKEGDEDALDRLFRRYYDRVLRIVRMRLGPRLRTQVEIEDVLQETFVAAVESFDRFEMRDEASLINWLARLAENRIIAFSDFHSAKKRDQRREVRLRSSSNFVDSSVISQELADKLEGPADKAATAELKQIVEECISALREDHRELILLRDYAGMGWEPIAVETKHINGAAARAKHSRAMLELARLVRSYGTARKD